MLIGIDIVDNRRFQRAMDRHPRLVERVFTASEREYCFARANPAQHFAARFAAKEAVGKALGTGVKCWQEIEVSGGGRPLVSLQGNTREAARAARAGAFSLSISHAAGVSVSVVVAPPVFIAPPVPVTPPASAAPPKSTPGHPMLKPFPSGDGS